MCISERQVARLACRVIARVPVRSPFSLFSHGGSQLDNHSRSTYQPTYRSSVGRHIDRCSTDMSIYMSTDTSRSTYRATLDRYVGRQIDRYSTDMSTDTSVESRSICRPIYRSRGAQNTHDPIFTHQLIIVNNQHL